MRQGEELAAHYAAAGIFLFPSLAETFGNVLLEAMASGLAVVAFDYAAAHQHLQHERNGLQVPCRDANAFVETVRCLIDEPARVRALGREASRAAERFAWNRIHAQLEQIFLDLVKDLAENNFPKLVGLWNGAIVPTREEVIEQDTHRFEEIRGTLFSRHIDPGQNIHSHF